LKALDLYCGLGGWSDGLAKEGFEVLGVEINKEIAEMYKHAVIIEDVRNLDPNDYLDYDLIVGSPPCRDFTQIPDKRSATGEGYKIRPWKVPKDPKRGLELIDCFLEFVKVAKPLYWLLENTPTLAEYLMIPPRTITFIGRGMRRAFWGNYPSFFIVRDYGLTPKSKIGGKYRKWKRAYIPLSISLGLARAVKTQLILNKKELIL
jgi:site-specific DNA-cytosine methylase